MKYQQNYYEALFKYYKKELGIVKLVYGWCITAIITILGMLIFFFDLGWA